MLVSKSPGMAPSSDYVQTKRLIASLINCKTSRGDITMQKRITIYVK